MKVGLLDKAFIHQEHFFFFVVINHRNLWITQLLVDSRKEKGKRKISHFMQTLGTGNQETTAIRQITKANTCDPAASSDLYNGVQLQKLNTSVCLRADRLDDNSHKAGLVQ